MRRRVLLLGLLVAAVALATTGAAAAANGGFTPEWAHSPNTRRTNLAYYVILGFTSVIFVLVEGLLIAFIWKYRARGRARAVEGAQLHGNTRLELIWTVIPVVILAIIATVIIVLLPGIANSPASAANALNITVEGHQFYWQFDYPNGARSIDELHVPVGEVVNLRVVSPDVVHSWWIPQLSGKIQAIPGRVNHTWFKAGRTGTYYGQCAELCGVFHEAMKARVVVTSRAEYDAFVSRRAKVDLGRAEFQGVCATCHGMQGQGGYGKVLQTSSLVTQRSAVAAILRNGRNLMPPVGNTWTPAQIDAVVLYMRRHIYKGAAPGGR